MRSRFDSLGCHPQTLRLTAGFELRNTLILRFPVQLCLATFSVYQFHQVNHHVSGCRYFPGCYPLILVRNMLSGDIRRGTFS